MSAYGKRVMVLGAVVVAAIVPATATATAATGAGAGAQVVAVSAASATTLTVYGLLDVGLVRESGGATGAVTRLTSGLSNGSRLGFKGTESLGNGWSALFVLESGVQLDSGVIGQGGVLFGRQSFVGLSGPAGTLTLGRQYTAHFDTLALADPFASGTVGDAKNLVPSTGDAATRLTNAIHYAWQGQRGWRLEVQHAPGEVAGSASAGRQWGGAVGYTMGALQLRLGYHYRNNDTPTTHLSAARNTLLAAVVNLGAVKLHAAYGIDRGINSALPRNGGNPYGYPAPAISGQTTDSTDVLLGVSAPWGPHTVLASYVRKDDHGATARDARQVALGHRYALAPRLDTYMVLARLRNHNGASYTLGNASETGTGNRAVSAGIRYRF